MNIREHLDVLVGVHVISLPRATAETCFLTKMPRGRQISSCDFKGNFGLYGSVLSPWTVGYASCKIVLCTLVSFGIWFGILSEFLITASHLT